MKAKFLIPPALFLVLSGFPGYGLTLDPRVVPSGLIDRAGVIRYKHIGPVNGNTIKNVLLPRDEELSRAG